MDALSGYLRAHFDEFQTRLIRANSSLEHHTFLTIDDLAQRTPRLRSIVESGAKGTNEHITELMRRLTEQHVTLHDRKGEMIALVNKCISSSQELSKNGRNQFASLYAGNVSPRTASTTALRRNRALSFFQPLISSSRTDC